MKHIIGAFSALVVLVMNLLLCITVLSVSADVAAAREYKAAVVAEIENSNFNPHVIEVCKQQALEQGYSLTVSTAVYDEDRDIQTAEILLSYTYELPLFGISDTKTIRGTAR